jgi:acetyl-CoA carboxylase / biotin carboxylase 1
MPKSRKSSVPILKFINDPIDRDVTYSPHQNQPYDPRWLLTGRFNDDADAFESGLLDADSFDEIMSAWAQSVVTGRGRLGGIPVSLS